jgi:hypothetical protein
MMWFYGLVRLDEEHEGVEDHGSDHFHVTWPRQEREKCDQPTDTSS